jgi:hypothetical protein
LKRATARTGWLAGLAVGMSGGFLALEGPLLGLALLVAMAALARLGGQLVAGLGGLLLGVGLVWIGLFGRLKLTCTAASGCEAPMIDAYLGLSVTFLVLGLATSGLALRSACRP